MDRGRALGPVPLGASCISGSRCGTNNTLARSFAHVATRAGGSTRACTGEHSAEGRNSGHAGGSCRTSAAAADPSPAGRDERISTGTRVLRSATSTREYRPGLLEENLSRQKSTEPTMASRLGGSVSRLNHEPSTHPNIMRWTWRSSDPGARPLRSRQSRARPAARRLAWRWERDGSRSRER